MKRNRVLGLLAIAALAITGCSKEVEDKGPAPDPDPYTKVIFEFTHNVNGADLELDTAKYENASSNIFGVTNLRYLVGRIRLDSWENPDPTYIEEYHLVNVNDPNTLLFSPNDTILIDDYQNITLFMGFEEKNNITGNYPDLDNLGWTWPPKYGGGYYMLRMDGNFYSSPSSPTQVGYDLGLGSKIRKETQNDTTYVPNPVYCSMTEGFSIPRGTKEVKIEIRMDVNKLFRSINNVANFNLSTYTSNLEENAVGSAILSENLQQCFRLGSVTIDGEVVPE